MPQHHDYAKLTFGKAYIMKYNLVALLAIVALVAGLAIVGPELLAHASAHLAPMTGGGR